MHPVKARFQSIVPLQACFQIYMAITDAKRKAHFEYEGMEGDADYSRQAFPHLRLKYIHDEIHSLDSKDRIFNVHKGETCNGWKYPIITCKDLVLLTLKSCDSPGSLPQESRFRKFYASINPVSDQLRLDLDISSEKFEEQLNFDLNAIITFKFKKSNELEFLNIIFPSQEYTDVLGYIDVLQECSNLIVNHEEKQLAKQGTNIRQPIEVEKTNLKFKRDSA